VNAAALDARKGIRRSRSGGSDSAFHQNRRPKQSPNLKQEVFNVDIEDAEVFNAFASSSANPETGHRNTNSITPTIRSAPRATSRSSGAQHPLDKMCLKQTNSSGMACVSPAFEQGVSPVHSLAQRQHSPLQDSSSSSRPASRLGGQIHLHNLLPHEETQPQPRSPAVPVPIARKRSSVSSESWDESSLTSMMETSNSTTNSSSNSVLGSDGSVVSRGELVLSPFSAFDDLSVGSLSISSSRSSKTRRKQDSASASTIRIDQSPPVVTSKHFAKTNTTTARKPTYTTSATNNVSANTSDKQKSSKK
jgi:hypothetical protein